MNTWENIYITEMSNSVSNFDEVEIRGGWESNATNKHVQIQIYHYDVYHNLKF